MVFHVITPEFFSRGLLSETWRVSEDEKLHMYVPSGAYQPRYNADGFICLSGPGPGLASVYGYTQLFRSGAVEFAASNFYGTPSAGDGPMIYGKELEKQIVLCYQGAVNRFRKLGRTGGIYIGFSLIGVSGQSFYVNERFFSFGTASRIQQNIFVSPEVFVDINEPEEPPFSSTLLPLVNTMWQVAGREGTPFISQDGVWQPFKENR
jgi:hypothetical protein